MPDPRGVERPTLEDMRRRGGGSGGGGAAAAAAAAAAAVFLQCSSSQILRPDIALRFLAT